MAATSQLLSGFFYPRDAALLDATEDAGGAHRIGQLGPFVIGDIHYGARVRLRFPDTRPSYQANLLLAGCHLSRHGDLKRTLRPDSAALYGPEGDMEIVSPATDSRHLSVKIDREAVARTFEQHTGLRPDRPIELDPVVDARDWAQLLYTVNRQLGCADSILRQPLVAEPLVETLLTGFLLAASRQFRDGLAAPAESIGTGPIRTAIEIIDAEAHLPLTTTALARRCHVSVRALQKGFQQHHGMSPMSYLRTVRLRNAHRELLVADGRSQTVESVARKWGFKHLGRFAALYRTAHGELPNQTLHAR
ncbi:MAG TPA: AraC family transcriptional regulator [Pseudonocardiaceae bacterium]|jgi:AraC-like DNA-binding protein